jgi:hypothetical protein
MKHTIAYPPHSTAAKTEMLTVCKKCGKRNDNGYQYCSACHQQHKGTSRTKSKLPVVSSAAAPSSSDQQSPQQPEVDIEEILRICGTEL